VIENETTLATPADDRQHHHRPQRPSTGLGPGPQASKLLDS
jgi:hypothetical protein